MDAVSAALCGECIEEAQRPGGEKPATDLLWLPKVPAGYEDTHKVCPNCLDLFQKSGHHERRCVLGTADLNLTAGGWSTPASFALRANLRSPRLRWRGITEN